MSYAERRLKVKETLVQTRAVARLPAPRIYRRHSREAWLRRALDGVLQPLSRLVRRMPSAMLAGRKFALRLLITVWYGADQAENTFLPADLGGV